MPLSPIVGRSAQRRPARARLGQNSCVAIMSHPRSNCVDLALAGRAGPGMRRSPGASRRRSRRRPSSTWMQVAEPLLERALDEELGRRRELVAVRREDELQQAAAERRAVDPLAGRREQHLLDQVADVVVASVAAVRPRPSTWNGKSICITSRSCPGHPHLGRHGRWALRDLLGALAEPGARLQDRRLAADEDPRGAGTSHCTVTHGCGLPVATVNGQPGDEVRVARWSTTGWPPSRTRGLRRRRLSLAAVRARSTVAPTWSEEARHQITSSAPLLIET